MTGIQESSEEKEGNLVLHARAELKAIGEDPETINTYIQVVKAFSAMGHSGTSAAIATEILNSLFRFENLSPLTDDPEEWYFHGPDRWDGKTGVWQNKRNGTMFSTDGGKTYHSVNDSERTLHKSKAHSPVHIHVWGPWKQEFPVLMATENWIRLCVDCYMIESKEGDTK